MTMTLTTPRPASSGDRVPLAETLAQIWRVTPCRDGETLAQAVRRLVAERDAALARAEAAEAQIAQPQTVASYLGLTADVVGCTVTVDGDVLPLTPTEARLAFELARAAGAVVPWADLLAAAWGGEYAGERHLLRINVSRLRTKLAEAGLVIHTRFSVGYRLARASDPRPDWDVSEGTGVGPAGLDRLTEQDIAEIRCLRRQISQPVLGARFGIAIKTVRMLQRGLP